MLGTWIKQVLLNFFVFGRFDSQKLSWGDDFELLDKMRSAVSLKLLLLASLFSFYLL